MLRKIPKIAKIAVLGTGALGFAVLGYAEKRKRDLARLQNVNQTTNPNSTVTIQPQQLNVHGANILEDEHQTKHQAKHDPQQKVQVITPQQQKHEDTHNQTKKTQNQPQSSAQPQPTTQAPAQQTKTPAQQPKQKPSQIKPPQQSSPAQNNQPPSTVTHPKRYPYKKYTKLSQIPLLQSFSNMSQQYMLIILDPGYTSLFQSELLSKISRTQSKRLNTKPLSIYRIDSRNKKAIEQFQKQTGVSIKQQDIYLLKNPYDQGFINFDFDMFLKHDRIPAIFLSQLRTALDADSLRKWVGAMGANDTFLLMTVDAGDAGAVEKNKLIAKYIQMQIGVQNYQNIKVLLTDHKSAQQAHIISPQTAPNTLHLIRSSNQFTFKPPNKYLYNNKPYHVIQSISLQDKSRNILLPRYLSKVETFTSMKLDSPYVCVLTIDRNRTTPKEEREILKVIGNLKEGKKFGNVNFVLKFGETQYRGAEEEPFANKKWCLKLANVDQLDKQTIMYQIKSKQQAERVGISQKTWMTDTFEYLYKEPQITEQALTQFINSVLQGNQPQYYKSQAKFKLGHVDKLIGQTFNQKIFGQQAIKKSHLVFQYSDHCQACQALSPVIEYFADVCEKFPEIGTEVHALNCDRNKVKGQPYSPYTPNLYLYSKNWRNTVPIRYPIIEYIAHTNVWGIYDFCTITDELKKIDNGKFQQHIKSIMQSKVKLTDF